MARYYATILHEYAEDMGELSDSEFGRLIRGLLQYSITGVEPKFNGNEKHYWRRVKRVEDEHKASYESLCVVNRENASKKGKSRKAKESRGNPSVTAVSEESGRNPSVTAVSETSQLESEFKYNTQSPNGDMSVEEKEEARARVISYYMDKISPQMSREALSMMPSYTDRLGVEAMLYAIDAAIDNGAKWPFIRAVLREMSQAGVHNADSLERYRRERQQRGKQSGPVYGSRTGTERESESAKPRRYAGETVL